LNGSAGYDAAARPYESAGVVSAWYQSKGTQPGSDTWDDPDLQALFANHTTAPTAKSGNETAAIVEVDAHHDMKVGAIVGELLGGSQWFVFFWRWLDSFYGRAGGSGTPMRCTRVSIRSR